MAFPSPTKTYHSDTYAAINPSLPQLSTTGKNVIITGGGSGIGLVIARASTMSVASSISILGRTEKSLLDTKVSLEKAYPKTRVSTYIADIVNKEALLKAFSAIKETSSLIDVLIANAGYLPTIKPVLESESED